MRVCPQLAAQFRQDELVGRYENRANKFRRQVWIKTDCVAHKVINSAQRLDSGETSTDYHKREQRLPFAGRAFRVRLFEMRDQTVSQFDRVVQCLDSQRRILDPRQSEEIRARTERDYQMVV